MVIQATNAMRTLKGLNNMNMKKVAPLALTALLLGTVTVGAEQPVSKEDTTQVVKQAAFVQASGKISSVEKSANSTTYIIASEENPFQFVVDESTLIFDKKGNPVTLKQGDTVTLYMHANQPMILIYPPHYSPAVVIVGDESAPDFVKVSQFDENFVSEDNQLKLNISDDTVIVNEKGEKQTKEAVTKQNAIVFYGRSTFSIPAQTTPTKIVVFPKFEDEIVEETPEAETPDQLEAQLNAMIGKDFYEVNGKKMVPLRVVAEQLGYQVNATAKGAILSKGALTYTITRGEKMYGYNKALREFTVAPALLESGKTYVEYDLALELLK